MMIILNKKVWAFTLAETLIVCSIFAVFVLWLILWINRAFAFMNNTRVLVRATNFAREWVEMVYNLRDSNWRKYSWERDKYRMYAGTWASTNNLTPWIYVIKEWVWSIEDFSIYADRLNVSDGDIKEFYEPEWFFNSSEREQARIRFPWTYSYYSRGAIATWNLEDLLGWTGIEFYRILRVYGIYCKNDSDPNQVVDYDHCSKDEDPKELRFCVKVFYEYDWWQHSSELCSIMTNFME